jgi:hypothetical protein
MRQFFTEHTNLFWAIIGAIGGVLADRIARFTVVLLSAIFFPNRQLDTLLGNWSVYHYSIRNGEVILRTEQWTIKKKRLRKGPWILTSDPVMKDLIYKGELTGISGSDVTCMMQGVRHTEEFYVRILYPIPSDQTLTYGLKVGVNFDREVFSTIYLFSRNELSETNVKNRLDASLSNALTNSKFLKIH